MTEQHQAPPVEERQAAEGEHPIEPAAVSTDAMEVHEMLHVDRYEGAWMRLSVVALVVFFLSITIAGFAGGFQVPGAYARVDPTTLNDPDSPFANPGLRELAPGKYEAYIRAQIWQFTPTEIRVPVGSQVKFYITSQDVQHGFNLEGTNVNMMVLPGQISTLSATFDTPGTYNFICHEYCGQLHQTMYGKLIVEQQLTAQ